MPGKKIRLSIVSCLLLIGLSAVCLGESKPGPPDPAKMEAELKEGLDQLVTKNVISAQQEEKILEHFKKSAPKQEPSATPPPQPKEQSGPGEGDPLGQLVKDGVITEEQAKAIQEILPKPPKPKAPGEGEKPPSAP